jgi:hypothetical protein
MELGLPALLGGIVLMYLYDSALLLYHDEVAFETRRGAIVAGGLLLELGGRLLYVPNPLTPHRPLYRLNWLAAPGPDADGGAASLRRLAGRLSVLAPWSLLLLALFFVGLPACLWLSGTHVVLLAWLAAMYGSVLAMLGVAVLQRRRLALTNRQLWSLARDALLCPPFGLNMLRKISLEHSRCLDLRAVLSDGSGAGAAVALARVVQSRIATSLTFAEAGGDQEVALLGAMAFYGRVARDAH